MIEKETSIADHGKAQSEMSAPTPSAAAADPDGLPSEFDVLVLGTGLAESIMAAACSRVGLTVLHLDRNEFYGDIWSSFSLEAFLNQFTQVLGFVLFFFRGNAVAFHLICLARLNCVEKSETPDISAESSFSPDDFNSHLLDGETCVLAPSAADDRSGIAWPEIIWNIPESESDEKLPETKTGDPASADDKDQYKLTDNVSSAVTDKSESIVAFTDLSETIVAVTESAEPAKAPSVSQEMLMAKSRRFNIDMLPKLSFACGSLVQVMSRSGVGRYAEFKCVNQFLCAVDDVLKQVPCSRGDVFASEDIAMHEKHRFMKFVQFVLNYDKQAPELGAQTFSQLLQSHGLKGTVGDYIQYAIAMLPANATALEGLQAVHGFLCSVGKYGNSPLLCTIYGSGELSQCFCRLCAVYGGVYCLRRNVDAFIMDHNQNVSAIVSEGKRIAVGTVIAHPSYLPKRKMEATKSTPNKRRLDSSCSSMECVQRAVLITKGSLAPDGNDGVCVLNVPPDVDSTDTALVQVCLLNVPPDVDSTDTALVQVLQLDHTVACSPMPYNLVHLSSRGFESASSRLSRVSERLTQGYCKGTVQVLLSVYYDLPIIEPATNHSTALECANVTVLPQYTPGITYDDRMVNECERMFKELWPDLEFLPAPIEVDHENQEQEEHTTSNGFVPENQGDKKAESEQPITSSDTVEESETTVDEQGTVTGNGGDTDALSQ